MSLIKLSLAVSVLLTLFAASPASAAAVVRFIPTNETKKKQDVQGSAGFKLAATNLKEIEPEILGVPTLEQLNEEIDKNGTVIKKKPLPNFKLPTSTKQIIDKLPSDMTGERKAASKKQVKLKTSDFNGAIEEEKKPETSANASTNQSVGQRPGSVFEIKINSSEPVKDINALLMASKAYQVGQYESAIAIYRDILGKQPNNRDALFGLATSYHRNKQGNQAKIYYAKLLELYPYDTEGQNNFLSLVAEEAPEDALKELDNLANANPEYAPIYAHKAMIYTKQKDDINAIKSMYKALQLNSDNTSYKYNLAVLFDKNGYYENAVKLYNDLIDDSRKGISLPVSRVELEDRLSFVRNKASAQN